MLIWKRNRLVALTPLFVLFFHILTYAIFSKSGGRFIQVVDWIPLVYFGLGLSWLSYKVLSIFGLYKAEYLILGEGKYQDETQASGFFNNEKNPGLLIISTLGILIGLSMPVVEALVPTKYSPQTLATIIGSKRSDELRNWVLIRR